MSKNRLDNVNNKKQQQKQQQKQQPEEEQPPETTVKLSREQTLGVKLLAARQALAAKNQELTALRERHKEATHQDAQRLVNLEVENFNLQKLLTDAEARAQTAENKILCKELGIPEADTSYEISEDGCYSYKRPGSESKGEEVPQESRAPSKD